MWATKLPKYASYHQIQLKSPILYCHLFQNFSEFQLLKCTALIFFFKLKPIISVPASNQIVSYNDFKSSSRLPRYSFPSKTYQKAYNQNLQFPKSSSQYSSFSKKKQDSRKISRKKLFLSKSEKKHQSHAETVLSALENLWKKHFGVFTKF